MFYPHLVDAFCMEKNRRLYSYTVHHMGFLYGKISRLIQLYRSSHGDFCGVPKIHVEKYLEAVELATRSGFFWRSSPLQHRPLKQGGHLAIVLFSREIK